MVRVTALSLNAAVCLATGLLALCYGLYERSIISAELGILDVTASVLASRPFITFVLVPLAILAFAHAARAECPASVRIRRGSMRRTLTVLTLKAVTNAGMFVGALILGSWVSALGLSPWAFTQQGTATLASSMPSGAALIAQIGGLTLFVAAVVLPLGILTLFSRDRPAVGFIIGAICWFLPAGSINGLWDGVISNAVSCAAINANCASGGAAILSPIALLLVVSVAMLVFGAARDLHGGHPRFGSKSIWSTLAVALAATLVSATTFSFAYESVDSASQIQIVQYSLSGDLSSPRTVLLALASFTAMLLVDGLKRDGAASGLADLELLRSGSWTFVAARSLIATLSIAFGIRLVLFVTSWASATLSGARLGGDLGAFVLSGAGFVILGALWWALLATAVSITALRFPHVTMIAPITCTVAVTITLLRLAAGSGEQAALWPALDAFADPFAGGAGRLVEAFAVLLIVAGILIGGRIALARTRRAPRTIPTHQEAVS